MSPTRELESALVASHGLVAGIDEVGRGALAGPVSVGVCVVGPDTGPAPEGLRDSKQLRPAARVALCDPVRAWALASAVGHACPTEIDQVGIVGALRLAALRALASLPPTVRPGYVLLDGVHDWLASPRDLFAADAAERLCRDSTGRAPQEILTAPVRTVVKGDDSVAVIAAASVLAKVERDELMARQVDPGYGWAQNKGYAAPAHVEGLRRLGPSQFHRRSWRLPGVPTA